MDLCFPGVAAYSFQVLNVGIWWVTFKRHLGVFGVAAHKVVAFPKRKWPKHIKQKCLDTRTITNGTDL